MLVAVIHENRTAARCACSLDVFPCVTDHEALSEVNTPLGRSVSEHPRIGFSPWCIRTTGVKRHFDVVETECCSEHLVHLIDDCTSGLAACHIGLVGHDDAKKPGVLGALDCIFGTRVDLKLRQAEGRIRSTRSHRGNREYAITIKKDRAATYHLVGFA